MGTHVRNERTPPLLARLSLPGSHITHVARHAQTATTARGPQYRATPPWNNKRYAHANAAHAKTPEADIVARRAIMVGPAVPPARAQPAQKAATY